MTAALLLLAGALADRFGRKRVLVIGLLVMLVSSVLCSVAPTVETLIAARLVQGVGGALVTPTSLALLNGTLRVADRARGIGIGTLRSTSFRRWPASVQANCPSSSPVALFCAR